MAHPVFESWYVPGGQGSGEGSKPSYTELYRKWIESFIVNESVKSVFDFGCGDWQFSKLINWGPATYRGVDVVSFLVERLKKEYEKPGRSFGVVDPENPEASMPESADLFVSKDVFQHLPISYLARLIPTLRERFRLVLLVNDWSDSPLVNAEIKVGEYWPIDPAKKPLNLDVTLAFDFGTSWQKRAYLWRTR